MQGDPTQNPNTSPPTTPEPRPSKEPAQPPTPRPDEPVPPPDQPDIAPPAEPVRNPPQYSALLRSKGIQAPSETDAFFESVCNGDHLDSSSRRVWEFYLTMHDGDQEKARAGFLGFWREGPSQKVLSYCRELLTGTRR